MTKTDKLAALLDADVRDKDVLEVACGAAAKWRDGFLIARL